MRGVQEGTRTPGPGAPMDNRPDRRPAAPKRSSPGFTLIELLVGVAIIALLIGLLLPALAGSRQAARAVACLGQLHNLHIGVRVYADDHRTMPLQVPTEVIDHLDLPRDVWRCPADRAGVLEVSPRYSSYSYLAPLYMDPPASGLVLAELKPWVAYRKYENNPLLPLFWDTYALHDGGRNVVYWSGSARRKDW